MSEMPSCEAIINELRDEALKYPDTGWLSDLARRDLTWDEHDEIIIIGAWYGSVDVGHLAAIVESLIDKKTKDLTTRLEQAEQDRVKLRNRLDAMRRQRDGYRNQIRKTEPTKEKTMSKTFKCVEHEEEVLEVYPFTGDEAGRKFSLLMPHVSSHAGIAFDSTTAPALALAILGTAGFTEESPNFGTAVHELGLAIKEQDYITAEAEAQAKLEAEALELVNAWMDSCGAGKYPSWAHVETGRRKQGLAVARRAREINKETPND